jgi:protease II
VNYASGGNEEGKLFNKQNNSFNDFIDVTEALIEQGYGDDNRCLPWAVAMTACYANRRGD